MANKSVIPIFILIISGLSLVIVLPNIFFSSSLSLYGIIYETESYYFPEYLSPKVDLNINADVGDIKIEYVDPSLDTHGKVDIIFNMRGSVLAGNSYEDYFSLNWKTTNSSAIFTLEHLSERWFDASLWSMKNISIVVSLRKDIKFDIMATINEGDFEIVVPYSVSIGNIHTNVSKGNIFYDFESCTIFGNITGIVNNGDLYYDFKRCTIEDNITGNVNIGNINLHTLDTKYSRNCFWDFNITSGEFKVFIYQYEDLGANITGIVRITNGDVYVLYKDNSPNIGAIFKIPYEDGFMDRSGFPDCIAGLFEFTCTDVDGFDYPFIELTSDAGIVNFTSMDLLANIVKYYYNITFEILEGSFDMELQSINF